MWSIMSSLVGVKNVSGECRRKMRMSGLCKVEMSASMGGRGAHGNGADRFEPTGTGPILSSALLKAEKRAELAQKLAGVADVHFETELRIGRERTNGGKEYT